MLIPGSSRHHLLFSDGRLSPEQLQRLSLSDLCFRPLQSSDMDEMIALHQDLGHDLAMAMVDFLVADLAMKSGNLELCHFTRGYRSIGYDINVFCFPFQNFLRCDCSSCWKAILNIFRRFDIRI